MEKYLQSHDGINLHYRISEAKPTALVFVHGWLGNANWWESQRAFFEKNYTVVQIDLPGHGNSDAGRSDWSSTAYARDIKAVVDQVEAENIVLVGHSMSGPYTLEASLIIPNVKLVVLVDTVKDLSQIMDYQQADDLLFKSYRNDFKHAVENFLPKYLFASSTPVEIKQQLQREFLEHDVEFAVKCLAPLYQMDIRSTAEQVKVPVRAINSDHSPTNAKSIRHYVNDFDYMTISGTGHYPMLEKPDRFNQLLERILQQASL